MNLLHAAGQAVEAVKQPGFGAETLRTLFDGTIIVAILKLTEAWITRRKKRTAVPLPRPGEAEACKRHLADLGEVKDKVERHGEDIARYQEFRDRAIEGIRRVETKVDEVKTILIERGGGK